MKDNSKKILLLAVAALLLAFLSGALVYIYKKTYDVNSKAEIDTAAWQAERDRSESIRTLDRTLAELAPERTELDSHFAKNSDIVPFLNAMENMAPSVGAQAQVDSVETLPAGAGLAVGLTATGTFPAVYNFLTLLENSPYELSFLSMDMHKTGAGGAGDTSGGWEAVFKLQLLSFTQ